MLRGSTFRFNDGGNLLSMFDNSHLAQLVEWGPIGQPTRVQLLDRWFSFSFFFFFLLVFRLTCYCLAPAVPAAGARPPRRAALALLPLVPRTRTKPPLAI